MKTYLSKIFVLSLGLLALTMVGCGYGPDTSLPTDNVGPMLDQTTTSLTTWDSSAYRLAVAYREDSDEFWIIDVEEPRLYSWKANKAAIASMQDQSTAVFYHFNLVDGNTNPRVNVLDIVGYIISDEGKVAELPAVRLRGEGYLYDADSAWFSPNGRWRIHYDSGFGLFSSGSQLTSSNRTRLEFGTNSSSIDGGYARILTWNPENTAFIVSTENEQTYLINVSGSETLLDGEAGNMAFERAQWLSDGRLILLKEEKLYSYDTATNTIVQLTGLGRITWFSFSPDHKYLATEEKVDCEYRADNDSWFPGNEYCNDDFFLYDENLDNRQRLTVFDRHQLHSPVWLPIEGVSPTWEVRSVTTP